MRTITGKALVRAALVAALGSGTAWGGAPFSHRLVLAPPLAQQERHLQRTPVHISEFAPLSEPLALPRCGELRPPEALLTPDPMLQIQDDDLQVRVSFVVGPDGHVHSAFILESGGPDQDSLVLSAVRRWRYRPALCNGVPTDSEARIRFALR